MLRKTRVLTALTLVVLVLAPLASAAPVLIGKIILNESPFEKFGALYFPFQFQTPAPLLFVLCETGVSPAGGCVNQNISDVVCIANNSAGEGVAAMMSDLETSLSLGNLPPDFPCSASSSIVTFLAETGKPQILSGKGIPTILPGGGPGPLIKVIAMSDLDPTATNKQSDSLTISTQ